MPIATKTSLPSTLLGRVIRAEGLTDAERHLQKLGDRTFLSLWSYAGIQRDQDGGKEVADLLVVFGDHILIFSDKDCAFPNTGALHIELRDARVDGRPRRY